MLTYHTIKGHLTSTHSLTKYNAQLLHSILKTGGSFDHVKLDAPVCEMK